MRPTIDIELISALKSVLNDAEHDGIENFVLQFSGGSDSVTGEFPSWRPGPERSDMRYFAGWDETLSRISRLKAKTFAAYDGKVGAAAVQAGLVMDLRLASAQARSGVGEPFRGALPRYGRVLAAEVRRSRHCAEDFPARRESDGRARVRARACGRC